MVRQPTALAAGLLMVAASLGACGSSSSSSSSAGGGSNAASSPTDASQTDFCHAFARLGHGGTSQETADRLFAVGTPSNISASARDGFVLLATQLFVQPDGSRQVGLEDLAQDLQGSDRSDVFAFVSYYGSECQVVPSM
jgi:hypothetical protein